MTGKRSRTVVSYNMSRIRSLGTNLEKKLEEMLKSIEVPYESHPKLFGRPDFAYTSFKIAIFADSDFWHGFDWTRKKAEIKTNRDFWIKKIERNITRDKEVTSRLREEGWLVLRLWGHDILRNPNECRSTIVSALEKAKKK